MLAVNCSCGETYYADEIHVGKSIRCSKCDQIVPIVAVQPPAVNVPQLHRPWYGRWGLGVVAAFTVICLILVFSMFSVKKDGGRPIANEPRPNPGLTNEPRPNPAPTPVSNSIAACESSQLPPPANGSILRKSRNQTGRGLLTIDHGTSLDADVKVIRGTRVLQWGYVRAGQKFQLAGIPPGNYRLGFCQGTSWNSKERKFLCGRACSEFDKPLDFTEERKGNVVEYSVQTITLHEVLAGNITKSNLDPAAFDSLDVSDEDVQPKHEPKN